MTHARDFEAAKLEANHVQAVNLVLNKLSDLDSKLKQLISDSKSPIQSKTISKRLPAYDTATNLSANNISTANLSATATNNLSTAATSHLSAVASSNLSTSTSSNATPKLSYDDIRKSKIQNYPKLEISNGCSSTDPQFIRPTIRILSAGFGYWFYPKPEFPELFKSPGYTKRHYLQQLRT
ncbi:hypothetical protein G9A89_021015 [Geosiphon pyriformis]|nr:hypothetical protein G9A89_021015 [Geosiphon pyriformis]